MSITIGERLQYCVPLHRWWMRCSQILISVTFQMQYPVIISSVFHMYTLCIYFSTVPAQWLIHTSIIIQNWSLLGILFCVNLCAPLYSGVRVNECYNFFLFKMSVQSNENEKQTLFFFCKHFIISGRLTSHLSGLQNSKLWIVLEICCNTCWLVFSVSGVEIGFWMSLHYNLTQEQSINFRYKN